jgi:hypothetical protein
VRPGGFGIIGRISTTRSYPIALVGYRPTRQLRAARDGSIPGIVDSDDRQVRAAATSDAQSSVFSGGVKPARQALASFLPAQALTEPMATNGQYREGTSG